MTTYLVLTNADAGSNDEEALAPALDALRVAGEVTVVATSSPEELDDVLQGVTSTVVVAGGDGSLHAVVNAVHRLGLDVPVGLIPLGTGNDFARGVGIPLEPAEAAQNIATSEPTAVDLIADASGSIVVNNVHAGVGAQAGQEAQSMKSTLGRFGYAAGAVKAGLRPKFLRVTVTVDGVKVAGRDQHTAQVAVGNSSSVGGGTELVPHAHPGDGLLDVVVSKAVGPVSRLTYLAKLRIGRHVEHADVTAVRGTQVTVEGEVGSSRVDLQACKLEYSIVSPK